MCAGGIKAYGYTGTRMSHQVYTARAMYEHKNSDTAGIKVLICSLVICHRGATADLLQTNQSLHCCTMLTQAVMTRCSAGKEHCQTFHSQDLGSLACGESTELLSPAALKPSRPAAPARR